MGHLDPAFAARVVESVQEAQRLLGEKQTGESVRSAQQRVADDLTRLIEEAKRRESGSGGSSGEGNRNGTPEPVGESANGTGARAGEPDATAGAQTADVNGTPARNRDGKAEESSDRVAGEKGRDIVREFRAGLVRDAWGHLPPQLRQQMLNSGSEATLPQYDELVRRYFESLARPSVPEP